MENKIDIVITTRTTQDRRMRLTYLAECIARLNEYTRTPHRIHVVDDASELITGAPDLLWQWFRDGRIDSLVLRHTRCGQRANMNVGFWLTFSDPVVFTDDDVLCPDVEPDWLQCLLGAMHDHEEFGIVALNSPGKNYIRTAQGGARGAVRKVGPIMECNILPGHFQCVRRDVLVDWHFPHVMGQDIKVRGQRFPDSQRCIRAKQLGYKVGYLTDVFCFHCGDVPVRKEKPTETILEPTDWKTLRPPEQWAW